ncbi:Pogo transposable element [Pyrenophora tritici-repentis]|nr:Pogo transposable element [Pyrenophora tritici-repentis]
MDPIQEAIAEIESREPGDEFSYQAIAKKYGVGRMTLMRRHKGETEAYGVRQLSLHPQHETELVKYIQTLTERRLPPTRLMIQRFASSLAGKAVSETWVSRFLRRHPNHLISAYSKGMSKQRCKADSGAKYSLYFKLLLNKIEEYNISPTYIFNMDEKGFQLGRIGRTKRIFSKALYDQKGVRQALEDGSTEWITVLACICSDGSVLSPSLIFKGANGAVQSSWVDAIQVGEHSVFTTSSPSGWSNNDIGLAWLKEVFERETRRHASTGYRLLLLDGHGSHVTMDFINYCNDHKILLAVYPPHATHTLQPLDVVMFKPLANAYSTELAEYLQDSQGLLNISKGDFFPLFWRAWSKTFKPLLIKRSFEATGIHPPNPEVVLKKFAKEASDSEESSTSVLSGEDWLKLKSIVRREVRDQSNKDVKKLQRSLHHIAAQNTLLRGEVRGLRNSLAIKKRRDNKSYTLQLDNHPEYHGGAILWSPKRVQQARDDQVSRQQQAEQLQLQKAEIAEMKEKARLCKLQLQKEKRVERERLREERRKVAAAKLAEKQHQKPLNNARKVIQLPQKGKRKASQPHKPATKRQKRVGVAPAVVGVASVAPATPARSRRSRPIQPTKKLFD